MKMNIRKRSGAIILAILSLVILSSCGSESVQKNSVTVSVSEQQSGNVQQVSANNNSNKNSKEKTDMSKLKKEEVLSLISPIPEDLENRLKLKEIFPEGGTMTYWEYGLNMESQKIFAAVAQEYQYDAKKYTEFYSNLLGGSQTNASNPDRVVINGSFGDKTYRIQIRKVVKDDNSTVSELSATADIGGLDTILPSESLSFIKTFGIQDGFESNLKAARYFSTNKISGNYFYAASAVNCTQEDALKYYQDRMKNMKNYSSFENNGVWYLKGSLDGLEIQLDISPVAKNKMSFKSGESDYITVTITLR